MSGGGGGEDLYVWVCVSVRNTADTALRWGVFISPLFYLHLHISILMGGTLCEHRPSPDSYMTRPRRGITLRS